MCVVEKIGMSSIIHLRQKGENLLPECNETAIIKATIL